MTHRRPLVPAAAGRSSAAPRHPASSRAGRRRRGSRRSAASASGPSSRTACRRAGAGAAGSCRPRPWSGPGRGRCLRRAIASVAACGSRGGRVGAARERGDELRGSAPGRLRARSRVGDEHELVVGRDAEPVDRHDPRVLAALARARRPRRSRKPPSIASTLPESIARQQVEADVDLSTDAGLDAGALEDRLQVGGLVGDPGGADRLAAQVGRRAGSRTPAARSARSAGR